MAARGAVGAPEGKFGDTLLGAEPERSEEAEKYCRHQERGTHCKCSDKARDAFVGTFASVVHAFEIGYIYVAELQVRRLDAFGERTSFPRTDTDGDIVPPARSIIHAGKYHSSQGFVVGAAERAYYSADMGYAGGIVRPPRIAAPPQFKVKAAVGIVGLGGKQLVVGDHSGNLFSRFAVDSAYAKHAHHFRTYTADIGTMICLDRIPDINREIITRVIESVGQCVQTYARTFDILIVAEFGQQHFHVGILVVE